MSHQPYFPAIKRYDSLTVNDYWMFYPQIEGKTRASNYSIDTLPRKTTMGDITTYLQATLDFGSAGLISVEDEGSALPGTYGTLNFIGPLVTATDASGDVASITITGSLMSSFIDVADYFYKDSTDAAFDIQTTWVGNEPSVNNNVNWVLNHWDDSTYLMTWNPVESLWVPIPAFDVVSLLTDPVKNIYNANDSFTQNRIADLADKNVSFYTTTGWTEDQLKFEMNSSGTASSNYIRLNGHRFRPMETGGGDLQLGYFNAADGVSRDIDIKFYCSADTTINGYEGDARIFRGSGINGLFEIANGGTAGIYLQAGTLSGINNEFRLYADGSLAATEYGTASPFTGTAVWNLSVDSVGNIIETAIPSGGTDTNFMNTDLTFVADRDHNLDTFDFLLRFDADLILQSIAADDTSLFGRGDDDKIVITKGTGLDLHSDGVKILETTSIEVTSNVLLNCMGILKRTNPSSESISFRVPASITDYNIIWPAAQGTAGTTFINGGSGGLDFGWQEVVMPVSCSAIATDLETGTGVVTFMAPYACTIELKASVTIAPTDADLVIDINNGGTTILSTKLHIDDGDLSTIGSATPMVFDTGGEILALGDVITVDIDQIGSTIAGQELIVYLYLTRTA